MPNTVYGIVNPETKEPLRFDEKGEPLIGELIVSSKAATSGALDGNNYVLLKEYDGKNYVLTNDIAKMYPDGRMEFLSRNGRAFTRYDGYKVKTYEVENIIKQSADVRDCVIIPFIDESKFGGNNVMAVIVNDQKVDLEEEKLELAKKIILECFIKNETASIRQIPAKIRFVDEYPITPNGKIDYKNLLSYTEEASEIDIDVNETNMSIDSISLTSKNVPMIKKLIK